MEDLSPFFAGPNAVDSALGVTPVRGYFDAAYVVAGNGLGMASTRPAFTLPTANVPADFSGVLMTIGSQSYAVVEHHPDGTGISVLFLETV